MLRLLCIIVYTFFVLCNLGFTSNPNYCISRTTIINVNPCLQEVKRKAEGAITPIGYTPQPKVKIPQAPNKTVNSTKILIQNYSELTKHP